MPRTGNNRDRAGRARKPCRLRMFVRQRGQMPRTGNNRDRAGRARKPCRIRMFVRQRGQINAAHGLHIRTEEDGHENYVARVFVPQRGARCKGEPGKSGYLFPRGVHAQIAQPQLRDIAASQRRAVRYAARTCRRSRGILRLGRRLDKILRLKIPRQTPPINTDAKPRPRGAVFCEDR